MTDPKASPASAVRPRGSPGKGGDGTADRAGIGQPRSKPLWDRRLRTASLTVLATFVLLGGWSATARLDSGAVAPGYLTSEGNTKTIEHFEGGTIAEIRVRNGETVEEGAVLLRLDRTEKEASSEHFRSRLTDALVEKARLEAERSLADAITYPDSIEAKRDDPDVARSIADQDKQFAIRRAGLMQTVSILRTQIGQAGEEIRSLQVQRQIAEEQRRFAEDDVEALRALNERGLAQRDRLNAAERDYLALAEKIATADIAISRARQEIGKLRLQIAQEQERYRESAAEALARANEMISALTRDLIVAEDSLRRVEILAPVAGTVQESDLTIGSVVRPGEPIMKVAPIDPKLVVRVQIAPNDIESVYPGMRAEVRFPAFRTLHLKPIIGELRSVSRDRIVDEQQGRAYFDGDVEIDFDSVPSSIRERLVAGMAADTVLPTGERTALAYLVAPISQRLNAAMREK